MSKNLLISIVVLSIISGIIISGCGDSGSNQITVPPTVTSTAIPDLVTIKGQALEINGTPIPNAFVVCVNQGLSASLSALADNLGNYLFKNLPPGNYRIEIWRSEGDHNSSPGSPIGAVNITVTDGTVTVNVTAGTIDPTATPTVTPVVTNTPTVTNTPGGPPNTPTATNTPGGPTNTPTATNTPGWPTNTPTPSWKNVGNAAFSLAMDSIPSLDVYNGTPYLAYQGEDSVGYYKIVVMMYNGINWTSVGNLGPSINASSASLYIYNGMPYIAYEDGNRECTVMKYSGTNWTSVGNEGFSQGTLYSSSLYVDNGNPYVAYQDWAYDGKCTVMKFDGTNWVTVGNAGFSAGDIDIPSLYVYNGTPYVAYYDYYDDKVRVMKFNGTIWTSVGSTGFSSSSDPSLYIYNGTPYLAYTDKANGEKVTVMMFDGTNWVAVGTAGFSTGAAGIDIRCLYVDKDGTPYVAYSDGANGYKATVMMYNGTSWTNVGNAGFSAGAAHSLTLSVSNGVPYVCYLDHANGDKVNVMKFSN